MLDFRLILNIAVGIVVAPFLAAATVLFIGIWVTIVYYVAT